MTHSLPTLLSSDLVLQAAWRRDYARFSRVGGHEACRRLPDDAFRSCISKASPRQGRYGYTHPQSGQRALGNRTKGYSGYFRHAGMPLCRRKCEMRKACLTERRRVPPAYAPACVRDGQRRSEEHTSELQSLMRISYAVFCLKKKTQT